MPETINASRNRFKFTPLYSSTVGQIRGLYIPPAAVASDDTSGWERHTVSAHEVGFPDMISVQYYGRGAELYAWAIMLANGIIDPSVDMYPGQVLVIPPNSVMNSYTSEQNV